MTIEAAITTLLESTLSTAGYTTAKVYPHVAPQSAVYPFVTYDLISDARDKFANYSTNGDMEFTNARIELQIWSATASQRASIEGDLRDELHGYRGNPGGADVRSCFVDSMSHFSENDLTGTDEQIYRAVMPLDLTYTL